MKKVIILLLFAAFLFACQNKKNSGENTGSSQEQAEVIAGNRVSVELRIEGMTCGGCENTITTGLESIPGVFEVTASHADSNAIVNFDKSKVKIEDLKNMVEEKGYTYISSKPLE